MITQAPKRELTIDFPIEKIKSVIDSILATSSYRLLNKNDLFNTYRFTIIKSFRTGIINVTLTKIDEEKTACIFEIINTVGGTAEVGALNNLLDYFLTTLSEGLAGKEIVSSPKPNCLLTLLLIIAVSSIIFFAACSKDSSDPANNNNDASISYKVNDTLVTIKGDIDITNATGVYAVKKLQGTLIPKTYYSIQAQSGANNFIVLSMTTDSLRTGNYHYDSTFVTNNITSAVEGVNFNGNLSEVFRTADYIDINITSYSNGYISGNFTGKMSLASVLFPPILFSPTSVTEGKFTNVKVIY